ncbi:MAG TPA: cytochrome c biogenesis protein ResB, partial [Gemmataceae bacterium]|nr:cytochrome c biogenesis protein ResB [Gemmataceae bacterium]
MAEADTPLNPDGLDESTDTDLYSALQAGVKKPGGWSLWKTLWQVLAFLASLRLTVFLFVLAFILVFAGTVAQVDAGIWTVVHTYFRTLYVWVPLQVFFFRDFHVPGGFFFPGGWLIGGALLTNLLAAHLVRFKLSWKRSGILLIHAGLVVMMLSEFITGMFAVEGTMTIVQGGASNYLERSDQNELAIIGPDGEHVATISDKLLRKLGTIRDERLPFDVDVERYMINSDQPNPVAGEPNPATAGDGLQFIAVQLAPVSGADSNQGPDIPAIYVTFKRKGTGESLGTFLVSEWWSEHLQVFGEPRPQIVDDGGKKYEVYLRPARVYKPYSIHLKKFTHELFKLTEIHKIFASNVRLINPETHEEREVEISMNKPLSYRGETFYQQGWLPDDSGTRLQVVRNPGWLMPYISCGMVSIGMLIHFGLHLSKFL